MMYGEHWSMDHGDKPFEIPRALINQFRATIYNLYPAINAKCNMHVAFRGAIVLPLVLRHIFYTSNKINIDVYDTWKKETEISGCMDIVRFIQQNTAIRMQFTADTPIYIWNGDQSFHRKVTFDQLNISTDAKKRILHTAIKNVQNVQNVQPAQ